MVLVLSMVLFKVLVSFVLLLELSFELLLAADGSDDPDCGAPDDDVLGVLVPEARWSWLRWSGRVSRLWRVNRATNGRMKSGLAAVVREGNRADSSRVIKRRC